MLDDLSALQSGVTRLSGTLEIINLPRLRSLDGLQNLTRVWTLTLAANYALTDFAELSALTEVRGPLTIKWGRDLQTLDGLQSLSMIGGELKIEANEQLHDLNALVVGLESLGRALTVRLNPELATCEAERLRDDLRANHGWNKTATISGNDDDGVCE